MDLEKSLLGMYYLCYIDPCVHISSNLVSRSSRIKVGNEDLDFGKFSGWTGQVRWTFSAATFDHCFEYNLLTVCPIDLIFLPLTL
jgi:hypothetical protein